MHSIRSKILLAYFGLAAGLIAIALFAWADLRFVEQKIAQGQRFEVLRDHVQEMRRHEKNTLLYRLPEEKQLALDLADRAGSSADALSPMGAAGDAVLSDSQHLALVAELNEYRRGLSEISVGTTLSTHAPAADVDSENALRQVGHRISTRIDTLADNGATQLRRALKTSQDALLIFASAVLSLALIVAFSLIRAVVRPLRELERNLKPLAEGRFDALPEVSGDREMVSLVKALKRMLDELDRRRRQVLQSEKLASLGVLAAGVAHELNNPLGNISAAAQILQEEIERPNPARLRVWTQQIDAESTRAQNIVRTLLDYAQRKTPMHSAVNLCTVIEKSLALLRNQFPAVGTLQIDIPANAQVMADPQRLQQVFINLIANALSALSALDQEDAPHLSNTRPDVTSIKVTITGREMAATIKDWPPSPNAYVIGATPPDTPLFIVCVCDDGPGIPAEHWPKVFDPFFTTRDPGRGIGLGLFIVAEIMQEQGASISVDQAPAGGARFCLAFPALQANPA